jgi:hypothetical protein
MQYLLMVCQNEANRAQMTPAEENALYQEYGQLIQDLTAKGKFLGGNQLKPTSTATTVRVRDGKRVVTDGPFAETKEQLGGYFLVDVADLDEAIAIAARIPAARTECIEVRPLVARRQAVATS